MLEHQQTESQRAAASLERHQVGEVDTPFNQEEFSTALIDLRHGKVKERAAAASALGEYGERAVERLIEALSDKSPKVRFQAARALGRIGDPRAVGPLMEALRGCLVGGSPKTNLRAALLYLLGIVLAAGAFGWVWLNLGWFWLFFIWIQAGDHLKPLLEGQRSQTRFCRAICEALHRIAMEHPSPEMRSVLPELNAIAIDAVHHTERTREASRIAARRIDQLTQDVKSLPLSASAPAGEEGSALPLASQAPAVDASALPRVSGGGERADSEEE
jgi:hypothetical protein